MTRRTFFGFLSGLLATTAVPAVEAATGRPLPVPVKPEPPSTDPGLLHHQVFS